MTAQRFGYLPKQRGPAGESAPGSYNDGYVGHFIYRFTERSDRHR